MKLKAKEGVKSLGWHGLHAEFDEKGFATVDQETGEALVAAYPSRVEVVEKTTRKSSPKEE